MAREKTDLKVKSTENFQPKIQKEARMDKDGCTALRITSFPSLWQNTREIPGEKLQVYSGSWFQSFQSGLVGLLLWATGTWCPGRKNKRKRLSLIQGNLSMA